jgi:acetyl esterase/lipase
MKVHPRTSALPHRCTRTTRPHRVFAAFVFWLALILTSAHCHAQTPAPSCTPPPSPTCTPDPTPTSSPCALHENTGCAASPCSPRPYPTTAPTAEPIPHLFQPLPPDNTVLEWRVFEPNPTPPGGHGPCILLLHEGGFYTGNIFSGLLDNPVQDLAQDGYYVFVAAYREAPCGLVTGQACHDDPTSGRPPQQTNDVKAFIRAMKNDIRCNGKFGVVGGSSGASHGAFAVFDTTSTSDWPYWNRDGDDRPLAVACLSGAYDFTDRTLDACYSGFGGDPTNAFRDKIENYTGTCVRFDATGGPNQWSSSPVAHLQSFTTDKPFRPMYFIHARYDSQPYHQLADVQCKLSEVGVDSSRYQVLTILDSPEHAFQYWRSGDGTMTCVTVSAHVLSFLDSHLK